jgi:UDP-glucose 4-epimerase
MNKLKNNPKELEILGDGGQSKSYLRVEEFIDAVLFSVQNAKEPVNVFNIGCDSFTNVKTIADIIVRGMGLKNVGYRFTGGERGWKGDIPICKMSVERINRLGWMARLTSDQAVEKTVAEMLTR